MTIARRCAMMAAMLTAMTTLALATPLDEIGAAFCRARKAGSDEETRALLSDALLSTIREAEARNARLAKAAPGDKPPLGDGVPWQSFPDSAPVCQAANAVPEGNRATVEITYDFPDQPNARWTDRLMLVETADGAWRIDDIRYILFATDSRERGLRRALREAFDY